MQQWHSEEHNVTAACSLEEGVASLQESTAIFPKALLSSLFLYPPEL